MTPRADRGLEGVNLLELAPRPVAGWREVNERVVIERPKPPPPWRAPFLWLSQTLAPRRVRLDEVGSLAWRLLDGRRTVSSVSEEVRETFGERAEPVEERLGLLIRMLRREGFVTYAGWDDSGSSADLRSSDDR